MASATMTMARASAASSKAFKPAGRNVRMAVVARAAVRTVAKPAVGKKASKAKAVQPTTTKTANPFQLGFTKNNELFVSRLAMLGFASSLIGEIITGKGALAQFGYEIGLNGTQVDWFVLGLIGFNAIAAVLPASGTFVPDEEVAKRPAGPLQDPSISLLEPTKFFGITGQFGFTKENELFVGRTAQLGFAASLIGELVTGNGPLAQFDFETGVPLQDTEFGLLVFIAFFVLAAINEGTGKFVDDK